MNTFFRPELQWHVALGTHLAAALAVAGLVRLFRPDVLARGRLTAFLAVQIPGAVLGGLGQLLAVWTVPALGWPHHPLAYFAVPYGFHLIALVAELNVHGRARLSDQAADYADPLPRP